MESPDDTLWQRTFMPIDVGCGLDETERLQRKSARSIEQSLIQSTYEKTVLEEAGRIAHVQRESLQAGILSEAMIWKPRIAPTGHVAHIVPLIHHPSTELGDPANMTDTIVQSTKEQILLYGVNKKYGNTLPLHVEYFGPITPTRTSIILKRNGHEQIVDLRSEEGQRILENDPRTLDAVCAQTNIPGFMLMPGIDIRQALGPESFGRYEVLKTAYSLSQLQQFQDILTTKVDRDVTLADAQLFTRIAKDYGDLTRQMDKDFVTSLTHAGTQHVQQLSCGLGHLQATADLLLQQGSMVIVSVTQSGKLWRNCQQRPDETNQYAAIIEQLRNI